MRRALAGEKYARARLAQFPARERFRCDRCQRVLDCEFAYDLYNVDGALTIYVTVTATVSPRNEAPMDTPPELATLEINVRTALDKAKALGWKPTRFTFINRFDRTCCGIGALAVTGGADHRALPHEVFAEAFAATLPPYLKRAYYLAFVHGFDGSEIDSYGGPGLETERALNDLGARIGHEYCSPATAAGSEGA